MNNFQQSNTKTPWASSSCRPRDLWKSLRARRQERRRSAISAVHQYTGSRRRRGFALVMEASHAPVMTSMRLDAISSAVPGATEAPDTTAEKREREPRSRRRNDYGPFVGYFNNQGEYYDIPQVDYYPEYVEYVEGPEYPQEPPYDGPPREDEHYPWIAADTSCIAQRTPSKNKAVASPANPLKTRKPVSSKVDTGLRRRSNLTRPVDAIPEETTSMTKQQQTTDQEDGPTETPSLVDPRYSSLRQEFSGTERSTDNETRSQVQEDNCPSVLDTATTPENKTDVIITAPPITDSNTSQSEDTLDETDEVFTQLSDSELLKAANEINISQNLINKKAFELEDINAEMELENNELNNKSCFSEGDCADEATRDNLDSIDTFDERNFTDKTLTDKVNRLVAKSLAATKDSDILIRGGEHNNLNQNNLNTTSHFKPTVGTPKFQSRPLPQRLIPPNPQPFIDIPKDQNDTPVVLNFTQPSVLDFSIIVTVPMNETPMNRYKPAYITTDNRSDKESVNE
uniref:Uncharacterized protein n=1 Tax=Trichogramma kaykai TaxID=54128 RepID=A0ABD2VSJ6_9HYME